MFSAFKRLAGKSGDGLSNASGNSSGGNNSTSPRPAHHAMPTNLQRKFAKGVQYNSKFFFIYLSIYFLANLFASYLKFVKLLFAVKIIIKGDRNVGKSCLFHRLQGQKFVEEYLPTEEIQVASIQWNYKATDDVVKVEVWDVVDRGRRRKKMDGLKMNDSNNSTDSPQAALEEEPTLDAEFLDVYKGTNGVMIMMDITKQWTFDYVQRELPKIPGHIPVIVLGNHCDMAHHRTVTADMVSYFVDTLGSERSAQVRYAESSMRNGFGLKLLHKFFNLPFLQLQRETLLGQLETNREETLLTVQELDLYQESDDADYDKFLDQLVNKRRAMADSVSATTLVLPNVTSSLSPRAPVPQQTQAQAQMSPVPAKVLGPMGGGTPIPVKTAAVLPPKKFKETTTLATAPSSNNGVKLQQQQQSSLEPITSVEDFVPDDNYLDRSFLEESNSQSSQKNNNLKLTSIESDSDTEETGVNPLVAGYVDDLSSQDEEDVVRVKVEPKLAENPLSKSHNSHKFVSTSKKSLDSESSIEKELDKLRLDDRDVTMAWRQSPEGGEDHGSGSTSSNVNLELLDCKLSSNESSPVLRDKKKHSHSHSHKDKVSSFFIFFIIILNFCQLIVAERGQGEEEEKEKVERQGQRQRGKSREKEEASGKEGREEEARRVGGVFERFVQLRRR